MHRAASHRPARRGLVDPRLIRYASATRTFIGASVALGFTGALLVIAQAWLLADLIAQAFGAGRSVGQLRGPLAALVAVVVVRAAVAWLAELVASRSSSAAKRQLRAAMLEHVAATGPGRPGDDRTGDVAVLATRGMDALDGYFSLYLPQILLAVIVPAAVVAAELTQDWISGSIIVFTLPLIPVFMALVGATTRDRNQAQFRILQRLAGHFLDVVAGLPTLKVYGRAKPQLATIREVSDRYRKAAMATLRVAFLASITLELVATISVALVAVAVGVRLLYADLDLRTAVFVLVLAPEAYLPLRQLGANYHASAEGVSAAQQAFEVLETPAPPRGRRTEIPDLGEVGIAITELTVWYPGRAQAALDAVSLTVDPGEIVAVRGSSGCGKSTLLRVLLAFTAPDAGSVQIGDAGLSELDPDRWREHVSWVPQRPHLFAGSIADNIRLGRPDAPPERLWDAVAAAGLQDVVASRPDGLDVMLGDRGAGLSAGERQRVALARAFVRDAPLLLLDEPTANLDAETEALVLAAVRRLIGGRTVVLVAHRPALVALADRVVALDRVAVAA